ncbi:MAG: hypothetical protein U5N86_01930 [Planctomycetota bacterium]|nr:hypothetical protein [Planctomycetota bacterium]
MTKHDKAAAVCSKTVFFEVPNGNVNSIYSAFALLISLLLLCSILTVEGEDAVLSMHRADAARTANYAATPLRSKPVRKWFYQSPLPPILPSA